MENTELFAEDELQRVPEEKLYNLNTIMAATFLGGPLAGGYLLYRNYMKMGEEEGAKNSMIWAFLITVVIFGCLILLPDQIVDNIPNFVIPWLSAGGAYFAAKKMQGVVLDDHKVQGGVFYSRWHAVWVGLACAVITIILMVPLVFLLPE